MKHKEQPSFSGRERQIMDVIYRLEQATARDIHAAIPDAPSYTSVRTHLRTMIEKGYLHSERDGMHYVYTPVMSKKKAKSSALSNMLTNFFSGSPKELIATLIDNNAQKLGDEELEQISKLIEAAKKEGR